MGVRTVCVVGCVLAEEPKKRVWVFEMHACTHACGLFKSVALSFFFVSHPLFRKVTRARPAKQPATIVAAHELCVLVSVLVS